MIWLICTIVAIVILSWVFVWNTKELNKQDKITREISHHTFKGDPPWRQK